jgi:cytochrome c oxidase subunit 2
VALSPIALELGSSPWSPSSTLSTILSQTLSRILLWDLPKDAAAHGSALDRHLLLNLWIALGLLVIAHLVLFAGLLLRRRASAPGPRRAWLLEYLPLTLLALLFAALTVRAERLWAVARYTGADPAALQVEVTGVQFAWYFRYPGQDAAFGRTDPRHVAPGEGNPLGIDPSDPRGKDDLLSSQLVLPANREVDLRLNAQDVIHGFFVPELRLKQNAVPGQTIHVHFTPTTPGTYAILCSQLCGMGHYRMQANLRVLPPTEFASWLAAKEKAAAQ